MRHHVDRADVLTFDSKQFINGLPVWVRKIILVLEWAYIPAVELLLHTYVILLPFLESSDKQRARRPAVAVTLAVAWPPLRCLAGSRRPHWCCTR
jgi:hypothetical protein